MDRFETVFIPELVYPQLKMLRSGVSWSESFLSKNRGIMANELVLRREAGTRGNFQENGPECQAEDDSGEVSARSLSLSLSSHSLTLFLKAAFLSPLQTLHLRYRSPAQHL